MRANTDKSGNGSANGNVRAIDEPPPFLRSWGRVYTAVLIYLAAVITLFYLFAKAYSS